MPRWKNNKNIKLYAKILGYVFFVSVVIWYILQPLSGWKLIPPWILVGVFFIAWRIPNRVMKKTKEAKRYL